MRTKILFIALLISIGVGIDLPAYGIDLLSVYQQALQNDPMILQADAIRYADREAVPQSEAGLLPGVNATASTNSIHSSEQAPDQMTGVVPPNSINAHGYQLSLAQPLFNLQSWMKLRAAHNSAKKADATYNAALQDLMMRVANAYFGVLQAQDNYRFIKAYEKATASQLKQVKEQYEVGLKTMTDVYQAQASDDTLHSQEISAQNAILNNLQALRQITGTADDDLSPLQDNLPLISPKPNDENQWVHAAEQNNWSLIAERYAEQAAKENIRVNYAGHFPTVSAVGTYQSGTNFGVGAQNINQWQSNVGVQVNLPLFQGGLVSSQTRQAQDQYLAASDAMEVTHRQVIFDTQQSFNNVAAGISKIQADKLAVTSSESALESTQAGFEAGTKTILDVLTAQQNRYQSQAMLASDQYGYIINTLTLKKAAGTLSVQDMIAINRWLQATKEKHSSSVRVPISS